MFHIEITGDFDDDLTGAAIAETEKQLTERARAYVCPSHGRSTRAQVTLNRETDELEFSGMCCEPAIKALVLSVSDVVEDEDAEAEGEE